MVLHFDREPVPGVKELIGRYDPGEFDSPTRSTVPLLSLLRESGDMWQSILAQVGIPAQHSLHLEYTVAPPRGRGRASHTDAMVIAGERACAIEAKWTEPAYATVRKWLGSEAEQTNREEVMKGWMSLLQPHATRVLHLQDLHDVIYQTVHRAASACAAGPSPSLAYLVFSPQPSGTLTDVSYMMDAAEKLSRALGEGAGFRIHVVEVELRPTEAFNHIAALPKGIPETGAAVRAAIQGERLFEFAGYRVHTPTSRSAGTIEPPLPS